MIEAQPPHTGTSDSDEDMAGPTMDLDQLEESLSEHESMWEGRSRSSRLANDSSSLMSASDLYDDDPDGLFPDPVQDEYFSDDKEGLSVSERFQKELASLVPRSPSPAASAKSLPSPTKPKWTGPDGKSFDYDRASDSASLRSTPSPKKRKWEAVEDGEELGMYDNSEDEAADRRAMEREEATQHTPPPPPAGSPPPPPPPQESTSSATQVEQLSTLLKGLQHTAAAPAKKVTDAPKTKGKLKVVPKPKLLSRLTNESPAAAVGEKPTKSTTSKKNDARGEKRTVPEEFDLPDRPDTPRPVQAIRPPQKEASQKEVPQKERGSQHAPIEIDMSSPQPSPPPVVAKKSAPPPKKVPSTRRKPTARTSLPVGPLPGFVALSEAARKGKGREELLPFPLSRRETDGFVPSRQPSTLLTKGIPVPPGQGRPLLREEVAKVDRAPNPHMPTHEPAQAPSSTAERSRPSYPDDGFSPRGNTPVGIQSEEMTDLIFEVPPGYEFPPASPRSHFSSLSPARPSQAPGAPVMPQAPQRVQAPPPPPPAPRPAQPTPATQPSGGGNLQGRPDVYPRPWDESANPQVGLDDNFIGEIPPMHLEDDLTMEEARRLTEQIYRSGLVVRDEVAPGEWEMTGDYSKVTFRMPLWFSNHVDEFVIRSQKEDPRTGAKAVRDMSREQQCFTFLEQLIKHVSADENKSVPGCIGPDKWTDPFWQGILRAPGANGVTRERDEKGIKCLADLLPNSNEKWLTISVEDRIALQQRIKRGIPRLSAKADEALKRTGDQRLNRDELQSEAYARLSTEWGRKVMKELAMCESFLHAAQTGGYDVPSGVQPFLPLDLRHIERAPFYHGKDYRTSAGALGDLIMGHVVFHFAITLIQIGFACNADIGKIGQIQLFQHPIAGAQGWLPALLLESPVQDGRNRWMKWNDDSDSYLEGLEKELPGDQVHVQLRNLLRRSHQAPIDSLFPDFNPSRVARLRDGNGHEIRGGWGDTSVDKGGVPPNVRGHAGTSLEPVASQPVLPSQSFSFRQPPPPPQNRARLPAPPPARPPPFVPQQQHAPLLPVAASDADFWNHGGPLPPGQNSGLQMIEYPGSGGPRLAPPAPYPPQRPGRGPTGGPGRPSGGSHDRRRGPPVGQSSSPQTSYATVSSATSSEFGGSNASKRRRTGGGGGGKR